MRQRADFGDADFCPTDPEHGRMYLLASRRQYCPHQTHDQVSPAFFDYDGRTPSTRKKVQRALTA